ncbi:aminopeptidase II. Metallo peptidase. MEROPS family M29 [Oscillibacter sp. PC13]|uniref:aminopeptidase n=1 Tax=Oscillibacter sp. PC13 TaxID=1855299 RepID=UPI0008E6DF7F|nr:aminopeptidase [Oscillibacter sp. PC13]SFP33365.1 aminopeptidase II. Metallo peptidase. MEROPS family M29 [Oscillibacter sp. PC13]
MEEKLQEYARLLIQVGLNVQKGQTLVISSPVECAFFARMCAQEAYDIGCREVVMNWHDDALGRMKYLHAEDAVFDTVPLWRRHFFNDYAQEGAAYLAISAADPENLKGVDGKRIVRAQQASGKALKEFDRLQMCGGFPWCIASIPIPSWAKTVFPDAAEDEAMEKLWDAIFKAVRISGDGTCVEKWHAHIATLAERLEKMNELNFKSLHYTNSLGTDLVVELPEGHVWEAGNDVTLSGQPYIANIPTEELFTSPLKTGVNGMVYSALPLVHDGNIIDRFHFVVKDGKIIEAHAEKGEETLKGAIAVDEGASFFGEVALVPYDSPISNQKILFYNTLFDENAACHIAFGEAYPCLKGGQQMTKEELKARGLNDSITHVDFMVGTPDLSIVGTTHDGREIPVFVNGNFAKEI